MVGVVALDLVKRDNGVAAVSPADNAPRDIRFIMAVLLGQDLGAELVTADNVVHPKGSPLRGPENPEIQVKVSDLTKNFLVQV